MSVGDEYSAVLSSLKVLSWIMIAINADREHLLSRRESTNLCVNLKLMYNTGNIYFSYWAHATSNLNPLGSMHFLHTLLHYCLFALYVSKMFFEHFYLSHNWNEKIIMMSACFELYCESLTRSKAENCTTYSTASFHHYSHYIPNPENEMFYLSNEFTTDLLNVIINCHYLSMGVKNGFFPVIYLTC